jgi:hypothetical protein
MLNAVTSYRCAGGPTRSQEDRNRLMDGRELWRNPRRAPAPIGAGWWIQGWALAGLECSNTADRHAPHQRTKYYQTPRQVSRTLVSAC